MLEEVAGERVARWLERMRGFAWAVSIEDTFVPQPHPRTGRVLDEYELTQHYRLWREDVDLVASLGLRCMRWGVPWHRVEVLPGRFDWRFTDAVLERMAEHGIEPIVDLVHYGCPVWLEGSFAHPDYPRRVAAYAAAFVERYRGRAAGYTPLNEPVVNADFCGRHRTWPPYLQGEEGYARVLVALCEGMSRTVAAIRELEPGALVVQVEATAHVLPAEPALAAAVEAHWERHLLPTELLMGRVGEDHRGRDQLRRLGVPDERLQWLCEHGQRPDVMGVNYYPHLSSQTLEGPVERPRLRRRRGSGADLREVLARFQRRFELPVMVTETSDRAAAWRRSRWLEESVAAIAAARGEGLPVVGYTWWPLFCLVDWRWRKGGLDVDAYLCRMGLYYLRRAGGDELRRVPSALAARFAELAASGAPSTPSGEDADA